MQRPFRRGWLRLSLVLALLAIAAALAILLRKKEPRGAEDGFPLIDVTSEAGIAFRHESGARGEMLNPETFGPGAGFLDYDRSEERRVGKECRL